MQMYLILLSDPSVLLRKVPSRDREGAYVSPATRQGGKGVAQVLYFRRDPSEAVFLDWRKHRLLARAARKRLAPPSTSVAHPDLCAFPSAIGYPEVIRFHPHHSRSLLLRAILSFLLFSTCVTAQEEDQWRDLLTEAQRAVGNNQAAEAEQAYTKALHEAERFGPDDWRVGATLQGLGQVYRTEKKLPEAVSALQRALAVTGRNNDDDTAEMAGVRYDLGRALLDSGRPADAVLQARRALASYQTVYGGTSLEAAGAFCLLGDSLRLMRNFIDAEEPIHRCADIREQQGGIESVGLADALYSLALTYVGEKKFREAEPRFTMAEKIREKKLGITSPQLAQIMEDHASLLRSVGRDKEAERLEKLSQAIRHSEKKNR